VLAELAGKRWLEGRIGDASGFAERALESGALLAAEGPLSVGFNHALAVLIDADRQDLALPALEAGLALAEEQGSLLGVASLLGVRAIAAWKRGEVMAVIADAEALLALLKVSHTPVVDPVQWGYLAAAQAERGDLEGAEASLVRGGCGPELPRLTYTGMPFVARARLRLAQGRPAEALEDLVELEARQAALGVRHLNTPWRHLAVEAALALGERRRALGFATELSELTETWDTPSARGLASAALGLATGGGEGIERLEVGALLLAASPARLDHARVLVRLGETMRREGHRGAARGPLRQGLEAARACGATALASRAHEELVAAGSRPRRLSFSGVESLTASERRVVDLAASGRTNREIAATLLVSIRTVENHLGHAYNKLGIGSRRDLPAALAGPVPEEAGTARRA
jgi:ATP/maltotriose-dependent transcriptional regulator MalT